jgi:hypothetical protein
MHEAMHAARLAMLEGAVCALLRECSEEQGGPDQIVIRAARTMDGETIDVEYITAGRQTWGESL